MEGAIICAIIFYFVYRILENLIHRKERLIVAQKIETPRPSEERTDRPEQMVRGRGYEQVRASALGPYARRCGARSAGGFLYKGWNVA